METNRERARESGRHLSQEDLIRFGRRILSPSSMHSIDDHLAACEYCQKRFGEIPATPFYALGRPFPGVGVASPYTMEGLVRELCAHLDAARESGRPVRVAGDGLSEKLLYQCVAIATSRMWRDGHSVEVCGSIFAGARVPARPNSEIAVLLDAPVFEPRLSDWLRAHPGRVIVLVGHVADWDQVGLGVDFRPEAAGTAGILGSFVEQLKGVARRGNDESEFAYLNAAGVDLPEVAFADPTDLNCPFVPLQDSRGYPLPFRSLDAGQWLARDVLGQIQFERLMRILERIVPEIHRAPLIARLRLRSHVWRSNQP